MPLLSEQRKDRLAAVTIRVGGILVILVVVAIVVNIGLEALPLFGGAKAGEVEVIGSAADVLAAGTDPRRELVWTLDDDGFVRLDRDVQPDPDHRPGGRLGLDQDPGELSPVGVLVASERPVVRTVRPGADRRPDVVRPLDPALDRRKRLDGLADRDRNGERKQGVA